MRVWLPSLEGNGQTRFVLNNNFSFSYDHYDISDGTLRIETLAIGALIDCRFQILFEIALNHFVRDQYRDAVVAAYAALERFREFYLLVGFLDRNYSSSLIENFWSTVGSQSERQLGAYHSMVILREGCVAPELSNKYINYRNKTIHQGIFPDEKPTREYLEAILDIINNRLLAQANNPKPLVQAKDYEYQTRRPENVSIELSINPLIVLEISTEINLQSEFEARIKRIQEDATLIDEIAWPYT